MEKKNLILWFKKLFTKEELPADIVFKEKPSLILLALIYILAILAIILVAKFYNGVVPFLTLQITSFFKGVKGEWVESIFLAVTKYIYLLIVLILALFHVKREITSYTLTKKDLVVRKGLFVRREIYIPVSKILNISIKRNFVGMLARYGSIDVDLGGYSMPITMENISNPREKVKLLLQLINKN